MPLTQNDWRQFPTPCPSCAQVSGVPVSVQSKTSDEVIVTMRCRQCAHEWAIHRATPMLRQKPDQHLDDA
jgi:DNA-directed RNA polymerase subunit M/transcription elongation factor TFIIS